jgi:hypothetical protein
MRDVTVAQVGFRDGYPARHRLVESHLRIINEVSQFRLSALFFRTIS